MPLLDYFLNGFVVGLEFHHILKEDSHEIGGNIPAFFLNSSSRSKSWLFKGFFSSTFEVDRVVEIA